MAIKVAINGFGRIGRNVLRAWCEAAQGDVDIVAINDPSDPSMNAHLFQYDSVHGRFEGEVVMEEQGFRVNGHAIALSAHRDPALCPWGQLGVDVVLECSGFFASADKARAHLKAGAKKVLVSAPAGKDMDATVVFGVNDGILKSSDVLVSNASCTTNCLAPLVQPLHAALGIRSGLMLTVHAYTNDQRLTDSTHSDIRRARSATQSIIPAKTGAAAAVGMVLPELAGKLDGYAVRVPTINVSMVDLTFQPERTTTVDEVNAVMKAAVATPLGRVLDYVEAPLVSVDFNHTAASSHFDATQTRVLGNLVKVVAWYDNEWGFSNRMLDTARAMMLAQ